MANPRLRLLQPETSWRRACTWPRARPKKQAPLNITVWPLPLNNHSNILLGGAACFLSLRVMLVMECCKQTFTMCSDKLCVLVSPFPPTHASLLIFLLLLHLLLLLIILLLLLLILLPHLLIILFILLHLLLPSSCSHFSPPSPSSHPPAHSTPPSLSFNIPLPLLITRNGGEMRRWGFGEV